MKCFLVGCSKETQHGLCSAPVAMFGLDLVAAMQSGGSRQLTRFPLNIQNLTEEKTAQGQLGEQRRHSR